MSREIQVLDRVMLAYTKTQKPYTIIKREGNYVLAFGYGGVFGCQVNDCELITEKNDSGYLTTRNRTQFESVTSRVAALPLWVRNAVRVYAGWDFQSSDKANYEWLSNYKEFEVHIAYPYEFLVHEALLPYRNQFYTNPFGNVYGYVPVNIVEAVIDRLEGFQHYLSILHRGKNLVYDNISQLKPIKGVARHFLLEQNDVTVELVSEVNGSSQSYFVPLNDCEEVNE